MKKNVKHTVTQQETLFAAQESDQDLELDDLPDDLSPTDISDEEESDAGPAAPTLADEPLFSTLLRHAVQKQWGDDPVLNDFVTYVAAPLSELLGHVAAKGGDFAAEKRAEAEQQGKSTERVEHYSADQSLRAHLVNGLFPVLHIAKTLQRWGAPQFRYYDDSVRRLFIGGYVLHDWLKLPQIDAELKAAGLRHDLVNAAQHLPLVENIFTRWGQQLGLDAFFAPDGGLQANLHDLIFVASNTQVKWGTDRNLSTLPNLRLAGPQRDLAEQLSRLADYLAYIGRTPRAVATDSSIRRELLILSNQKATLVYQHIAEVRGVLTNFIQNAALNACSSEDCVPLLYAPTGVVYLVRRGAFQPPDKTQIAEQVVERMKKISKQRLSVNFAGFKRDGKGMKHADYYNLFFEPLEMIGVGLRATLKFIHPNKPPSAGKRYDKLVRWLPLDVTRTVMEDIRVDQLAEWCFLAEKTASKLPGGNEVFDVLLKALNLDDLRTRFLEVPRNNRAGGVGYNWYFAAGHYLQRNPGLDPEAWETLMHNLAAQLVNHLRSWQTLPISPLPPPKEDFTDLRAYVLQVLSFGPSQNQIEQGHSPSFDVEFHRYCAAKTRSKEILCSLCSSSHAVRKQQESAMLFAPQVYSNKLTLHGPDVMRNICSICGLEIMLRQLLMNNTSVIGGDFEDRGYRYLFFYPMYFFTPETLALFRDVQDALKGIELKSLPKWMEKYDQDPAVLDLTPQRWQRIQDLLLAPSTASPAKQAPFFRMQFDEHEPITFFFMGVPPPKKVKKRQDGQSKKVADVETWVLPTFLSLLLPLCTDVKVVSSSAPMPFINSADEFDEVVFIDTGNAAVANLLGRKKFVNINQLLPTLNQVTAAYFTHLHNDTEQTKEGFDYRWQDMTALARNLADSSLYVFHYLKKWQRQNHLEQLPREQVQLHLQYQEILASLVHSNKGKVNMSHARILTELYWRFYRAKRRPTSNSILRPVSIAARTVMTADPRIYVDSTGLVEMVRGELYGFIDRVMKNRADGYVPRVEVDGEYRVDNEAVTAFATYFVEELFFKTLQGDVSALRGRQLNLLKNACEVIYRDLAAEDWAARKAAGELDEEVDELDSVDDIQSPTLFD